MKVAELSSFISFDLIDSEELEAYSFNNLQVAGIQNLLASEAETLLKVVLETNEITLEGAKKLAYSKGWIDGMKHLLAMADAIKERREAAQKAAE